MNPYWVQEVVVLPTISTILAPLEALDVQLGFKGGGVGACVSSMKYEGFPGGTLGTPGRGPPPLGQSF